MNKENLEFVGKQIIGAAIFVHTEMGPGLLESVYQSCLLEELKFRKLTAEAEVKIPLFFRGKPINKDYRIDILVENAVIIEVKALEAIAPVHLAQLFSYLKLSDKWLGYLLNFNVVRMKDGINRIVSGPYR